MRLSSIVLCLAAGCVLSHEPKGLERDEPAPRGPVEVGPELEEAPEAAPRLEAAGDLATLGDAIDSYFDTFGSQRVHVQLDRPLYRPGDTVWIKTWSLVTRGLGPDPAGLVTYELLDPQGQVVESKQVQQSGGAATNDFALDAAAPGGKWAIRATSASGAVDERPFVVSSYATPRIRKQLEFVREAYGPGDRVEALVELEQGTGAPLAGHPVHVLLQVGGETVLEQDLTTDDTGAVLVSAALPERLSTSDGLLTVLVSDAGVTESISRSVPIVLDDVSVALFPEGGDLVEGLPGRVYFEATNAHGEPADVSGVVVDDRGVEVTRFDSVHDGLGRFALVPEAGRTYIVRVTSPATLEVPVPAAAKRGCTVRSFDDFASRVDAVRVGVRCSSPTEVAVSGVPRDPLRVRTRRRPRPLARRPGRSPAGQHLRARRRGAGDAHPARRPRRADHLGGVAVVGGGAAAVHHVRRSARRPLQARRHRAARGSHVRRRQRGRHRLRPRGPRGARGPHARELVCSNGEAFTLLSVVGSSFDSPAGEVLVMSGTLDGEPVEVRAEVVSAGTGLRWLGDWVDRLAAADVERLTLDVPPRAALPETEMHFVLTEVRTALPTLMQGCPR